MTSARALAFLSVLCLAWPTFGVAANANPSDPVAMATRAADWLDQAALSLSEAESASDRIAALTRTVTAYEEGLSALREGIRVTTIQERGIRDQLQREDARLSKLVGILQTMEKSPETLILLHPNGPVDTARSGMLISEMVPALSAEVASLKTDLEALETLSSLQANSLKTLETGLAGIRDARLKLSQAVSERTDLPAPTGTDDAAIQALINSTETLAAFASSLAPASDTDTISTPTSVGLPVTGTVLSGFGDSKTRPGLTLATRPQALVTSPIDATIRFAGNLLDYGNVVILEPKSDVLFVFAGLGTLFTERGQIVRNGEAIGLMGGKIDAAQEILIETSNGSGQVQSETLYIEVRHGQNPVNPTEWFAVEDG